VIGPYQAILFDFDGVLVDSEPVHFECWNLVLEPFGFRMSWDEYARNCIGVSDRAMIRALCRLAGRDDWFDAIWAEYPRKKSILRERLASNVPMTADLRSLLHDLSRLLPLAVVTSSGRLEVEPALEAAGVRKAFATIVTGEDVSRLKPDPEPYATAARRLGVRCALVVEDSEAGQASGRAAGFDVLAVPSAGRTAELVRERVGLMPNPGSMPGPAGIA
jgi:beta-phosphoglucomutase